MTTRGSLIAYQAANKEKTLKKLKLAMAAIEAEIEENGFYPQNKGRIDLVELCRRAQVGPSTLKNATHDETKSNAKIWLATLKQKAPVAKVDADHAKKQKIAALAAQFDQIAQNYNRFKIEHDQLLAQCQRLQNENDALRRRINELTNADAKVVPIRPPPG